MSMAALSPATVQTSLTQIKPYAQSTSESTPGLAAQSARKTVQSAKTDTVTLSSQALQLARGGFASEKTAQSTLETTAR